MRDDLGAGPDPAAARVEQPERLDPLDRERRERAPRVGLRHGHAEHEERSQRSEGVELRKPPFQQRDLAGPRQDRAFDPECLANRLPVEPGGDEHVAQLCDRGGIIEFQRPVEARSRRLHGETLTNKSSANRMISGI